MYFGFDFQFPIAVIISSFNVIFTFNFLNLSIWVNFLSSYCQPFALVFDFLIFINYFKCNSKSFELSKADEQQSTVKSDFHRRTIFTIIYITFYQFNITFSEYRPSDTSAITNHLAIDQKVVPLPILYMNSFLARLVRCTERLLTSSIWSKTLIRSR